MIRRDADAVAAAAAAGDTRGFGSVYLARIGGGDVQTDNQHGATRKKGSEAHLPSVAM